MGAPENSGSPGSVLSPYILRLLDRRNWELWESTPEEEHPLAIMALSMPGILQIHQSK